MFVRSSCGCDQGGNHTSSGQFPELSGLSFCAKEGLGSLSPLSMTRTLDWHGVCDYPQMSCMGFDDLGSGRPRRVPRKVLKECPKSTESDTRGLQN